MGLLLAPSQGGDAGRRAGASCWVADGAMNSSPKPHAVFPLLNLAPAEGFYQTGLNTFPGAWPTLSF